jgi:hypothetical protein
MHASSTSEAIYLLQGVSDGDNYAALELWNSTGTKWQFAHKSFPGDEGDFGFIIGQVLVKPFKNKNKHRKYRYRSKSSYCSDAF